MNTLNSVFNTSTSNFCTWIGQGFFHIKDSWLSGLFVYCSYVLNVLVYNGCLFLHFHTQWNTIFHILYLKFLVDPLTYVWRLATQIRSKWPFGWALTPKSGQMLSVTSISPILVEWRLVNFDVDGLFYTSFKNTLAPKLIFWLSPNQCGVPRDLMILLDFWVKYPKKVTNS